jgi:Tfp pilus assembly protein PilO
MEQLTEVENVENIVIPEEVKTSRFDTTKVTGFVANFVIPLVALLLIVFLYFLVIRPSTIALPGLRSDLDSKTTLANTLVEKYQKLNLLLDFKNSVEENRQLVSDVLASEPLVPLLLTQVDLIARESGLNVTRLSYSIGEGVGTSRELTSNYSVVAVSLAVEGTYNQVVTFLSNLENSGRFVGVGSLRFTADSADSNVISASLTLFSPYVELTTTAITDDPIVFDLNNTEFQQVMGRLKQLKIYRISIDEVIDISELEQVEPEPEPEDEQPAESAPLEQQTEQPAEPEAPIE